MKLVESDDELNEVAEHSSTASGADAELEKSVQKQRRAARRHDQHVQVSKVGFTVIELGGVEVEVGLHKGPGLQLPATPEAVMVVLTYLNERYNSLLITGRSASHKRLESRKGGPHELLQRVPPSGCRQDHTEKNTGDTNKIRFDFMRGAFLVIYKDQNDTIHRVTKGFEVPRYDVCGNILSGEEYCEAKKHVLRKAREAWNALDQSEAPRLPI